MNRPRPTLRCLHDDLALPIPPINEPLDEVVHPLLAKAAEQFADRTSHERIRAIDDVILFKVKVQRWRGAVWTDADHVWLVAAGQREAGSNSDFYSDLAATSIAARTRYNAEHAQSLTSSTYTARLLPNTDDHLRYRLEEGIHFVRRLERLVPDLVRESLCDGREHSADLNVFTLGVQVRADNGHETYVAVCVIGSVPGNLIKIILDIVPGCAQDGWYPEAGLPERPLKPGEQVWSNLMDPASAAKLLDDEFRI